MTSQDDDNTVHVSMRMKFNFFLYNKLSLFNLNILVVKDVIPSHTVTMY